MSFTVAVWFWVGFHNHFSYPDHLAVHITQEGDKITCQSDPYEIEDLDCSKTYITVATPSNEGKRLPTRRFKLVCDGKHFEIQCK